MEKNKTNKAFYIIPKTLDETTSINLKDFFSETNRYLDNKSKFIVGDKLLIRIKRPVILNDKKMNSSKNELIEPKNNENNNNDNFNDKEKIPNMLKKFKKYYYKHCKHKLKQKSACSLILNAKEENKGDVSIDKRNSKFKNRILFRNDSNLENNMKNKFDKNLSLNQKDIHYELKSKKEILDIFKYYMNNIKENKSFIYRPSSKQKSSRFPKRKVSFKELMKNGEEEKKKFTIFSNYLSKKCNRANLLVNKIEDFNYKKYMSNYIEDNKILSERLGNKYWICDLRRSNIKSQNRVNYVVTGKLDKEPWEQIIDGNNEHEFLSDPSISQSRLNNYNKSKEYKTFIKKYPSLKSFYNIKIEGKNLLNKELNNFSNDNIGNNENIKYRLYKDPRELKTKYIKDMIYKQNYFHGSKSAKNISKKNNKFNI